MSKLFCVFCRFPNICCRNEIHSTQVRKFLEMTRDEVNYDQKVKQFVEDTNKYRKERKPGGGSDDKSSSRKKEKHKKRKSSQRESKKSKRSKEKRSKSSKRDKRDSSKGDLDNIGLREALKYVAGLERVVHFTD